ncbi:hypothetical protein BS50DRAFT_308421 [Corynespora cassiicola Philippines]|uniref:Uncharacterized protein n=1 Tax=Corynespora cassiicola Philippines TaxID=1448308 RepID=A0A2T2NYP9_CORCC|nr:hypothetical protein BS50DRAFT_308421 [Corynespora cassiicola Philippines]
MVENFRGDLRTRRPAPEWRLWREMAAGGAESILGASYCNLAPGGVQDRMNAPNCEGGNRGAEPLQVVAINFEPCPLRLGPETGRVFCSPQACSASSSRLAYSKSPLDVVERAPAGGGAMLLRPSLSTLNRNVHCQGNLMLVSLFQDAVPVPFVRSKGRLRPLRPKSPQEPHAEAAAAATLLCLLGCSRRESFRLHLFVLILTQCWCIHPSFSPWKWLLP